MDSLGQELPEKIELAKFAEEDQSIKFDEYENNDLSSYEILKFEKDEEPSIASIKSISDGHQVQP